jgi:hypothetical protein
MPRPEDGDSENTPPPAVDETEAELDPDHRVPYAPDFTPSTLGKVIGEDKVLTWLLEAARDAGTRSALQAAIAATCLTHIENLKSRRDMASHVLVGMRGYGLIEDVSGGGVALTAIGDELLASGDDQRDVLFARHAIVACNGQRLLDTIRRFTLTGQSFGLEDLALELDRHATSKNVSTMRAWLARAGIFPTPKYTIDEQAVEHVLGTDVARLYSLTDGELEFVLAARILERQTGSPVLSAPNVATLVDSRGRGARVRRKALSSFLKSLETKQLIELAPLHAGQGGARTAFKLTVRASRLSDEQLRALLAQSQTGFPLSELQPLAQVLEELAIGNADRLGRLGEMLAVHLCLMLGLTVTDWRRRAPQAEIDLIAERMAALSYQRWAVQVKNTISLLDSDRVDREVGAAAGTGVTHLLFVVPRATVAAPALRELRIRCALTSLHIYYLAAEELVTKSSDSLFFELRKQEKILAQLKRAEAERRASASSSDPDSRSTR